MSNPCEQHAKIEKLETAIHDIDIKLAVITEILKGKASTIDEHIKASEAKGGWRDRLVIVETQVENQFKYAVASGIVGGLIGAGAPSAVKGLASLVGIG